MVEEEGRLARLLARILAKLSGLLLALILLIFQEATAAVPLQPGQGQGGVLQAVQLCGGEVPGHLQEHPGDPHHQHHHHQCSHGNHIRNIQHFSGNKS